MRSNIYNILKTRIIQGHYNPGEIIREMDIAQEFQVSRTPVREVFQSLQGDSLITLLPYRGAQVTFIELEFFFQTAMVKMVLEEMAARLAARYAAEKDIEYLREILGKLEVCDPERNFEEYLELDTQFHRGVRQAGRNGVLSDTIERMQVHIDRFYYYARHVSVTTMGNFVQDFTTTIRALEDRDEEAAVLATRTHMSGFYEIVNRSLMG